MILHVKKHPTPDTLSWVRHVADGTPAPEGWETMTQEQHRDWTAAELAAGWTPPPPPEPVVRKIWQDAAAFWLEFTDTEKLAIIESEAPGIKLLREELRLWRGEVWSDDERVVQGIRGLWAVGILTEQRKDQILNR